MSSSTRKRSAQAEEARRKAGISSASSSAAASSKKSPDKLTLEEESILADLLLGTALESTSKSKSKSKKSPGKLSLKEESMLADLLLGETTASTSAAAVRSRSPKGSKKVSVNIPLEFDAELLTLDRRLLELYTEIIRDTSRVKMPGLKQSLMRQFVGTLKAKAVFLQDKRSLKPEKWTEAEKRGYEKTFNDLDGYVEKCNDTNFKKCLLDMFLYLNKDHTTSVLKNLLTTGGREDQLYPMYSFAWPSASAKGGSRKKRRRRCSSTRKI